jgi:AcrR family transcriptional regulator
MPNKRSRSAGTSTARTAGRPRSLVLEDVLDAAIELGLGGISMTALAARLGVGTATIYTYVASRDELVRLAALRQAKRPRLDDLGGDWSDLVRGHAGRFFDLWSVEPQLMLQHMQGLIGPDAQFDYLESFLAALVRRGFTVAAGYRLYVTVNAVVHGAVVRAVHLRALKEQGRPYEDAVRLGLAQRRLDELPHLRACTYLGHDDRAFPFEDMLERVIESFDRELTLDDAGAGQKSAKKRKAEQS